MTAPPPARLGVLALVAACAAAAGCGGGGANVGSGGPRYVASFLPSDVRLDVATSPGAFASRGPRIARDGNSVFVVWSDTSTVTSSIRFAHSSDGGASFDVRDVRVDHKPAISTDSVRPRLAVVGDAVFVAWEDSRNGHTDVYFNRSLDGGRTWLDLDRRLDTDLPGAAASVTPEIATDGTHVVVVWSDERALRADIRANRSADGGVTWDANDARLDTDAEGAAASIDPQIAMSGGSVVVVWADGRVQFTDIRMNRSDDFGQSWLASDVRLDSDPAGVAPSASPRLAAQGSTFAVVFEDGRSGASDIRFNRSLDGGRNWLPQDVRLDTDAPGAGSSIAPAIAVAGNAIYAAWQDGRSGYVDVRFNRSLDGGANWMPADTRLDGGAPGVAPSQGVDVGASGSNVFVTWQDGRDGRADIYVQASIDFGRTFMSRDTRVDTDAPGVGASTVPRLACAGASVAIVYEDERDGAADVRFNRSP